MAAKAGKPAAKAPKVTKSNTKTSDEDEEVSKIAPADRKVSSHPPTADMVTEAIRNMNDRGGSSLLAIKKSIAESHDVDVEKLAPFIKRFLKKAVETGVLIQTKGKGAAGSFKLPAKSKPGKKPAGEKIEEPAAVEAKAKKPAAKKIAYKASSPSSDSVSGNEEISPSPKIAPAKAKAPKPATAKARSPKVPKKPAENKKVPGAPTNPKASPKIKVPPKAKPAAKSRTVRKSSSPRKGAIRKS